MVAELIARGKASGNAARARRRAERAIQEGRQPGRPGPAKKPRPLSEILEDVRRLIESADPAALAALAAMLPERGDAR